MNTKEALTIIDRVLPNQHLSHIQELVFCQSWEGKTYQEIADIAGYDHDYVKEIGSWLWSSLSASLAERVTKKNFQSVLRRYEERSKLDRKGSNLDRISSEPQTSVAQVEVSPKVTARREDWGEAPDVSLFYGRTDELTLLEQWIIQDRCRLVALLGMGGIGKTALSVTLAEEIQGGFKHTIWRSMRNPKPAIKTVATLIDLLSDHHKTSIPETLDASISLLIKYLQKHRCLIVLDGAEEILRSGDYAGTYLNGYEDYGQILRRIGESQHQSCVILTSREQPREFTLLDGSRVRSHYLRGLSSGEGKEIFAERGDFYGDEADWERLILYYAGNPSAIKIVVCAVQEFFDRDISRLVDLLNQDGLVFEDIKELLDQHFDRLSEAEKELMHWLAINRMLPLLPEMSSEMLSEISLVRSPQELLTIVNSLRRRSLIVKTSTGYSQQLMISEYIKSRSIAENS